MSEFEQVMDAMEYEVSSWATVVRAHIAALTTDRDRLREALQGISDDCCPDVRPSAMQFGRFACDYLDGLWLDAEAALAGGAE